MGDATIPVGSIIAALIAVVGAVGTLFGLLMKAQKRIEAKDKVIADERKERADAAEKRNTALESVLSTQNDILERVEALAQTKGITLPKPRPPFGSNPGVRRGG